MTDTIDTASVAEVGQSAPGVGVVDYYEIVSDPLAAYASPAQDSEPSVEEAERLITEEDANVPEPAGFEDDDFPSVNPWVSGFDDEDDCDEDEDEDDC